MDIKLTAEEEAIVSLVMAKRGRKGGKAIQSKRTAEEKRLHALKMVEGKRKKRADSLT